MPQKVSLKGLQAIIRYNVKKSLAKINLSKTEYNQLLKIADEFISNASIEDLTKKGIVGLIINKNTDQTKRVQKGKGKRKRETDEDENRRKLFQNVDPTKIVQTTIPLTESTNADALQEPTETQSKPKQRSWFSRMLRTRPVERDAKKEPQMRPYTSWFDPYVTGRTLPSSKEAPRTNHYTTNETETDLQRHKVVAHRNVLNEMNKDIIKRRNKQESTLTADNEKIRRKAIADEESIAREGKYRLSRFHNNTESAPPKWESNASRRRREVLSLGSS
jgi:hypothetical protein